MPSPPPPPFGDPNGAAWKTNHHAYGPIGELLYSAAHFGCAITSDLFVRQPREVEFSLHMCPFQYLKPLVTQSVRLFRSKIASSKHSVLVDAPEIDYRMLHNSFKKVDNAWFTTLSDWNNDQLSQLDFSTRRIVIVGQNVLRLCISLGIAR